MGNSTLWNTGSVFTSTQIVNRNTLTSVRIREQKMNRKCLRSSGTSCSPDKSTASTTIF